MKIGAHAVLFRERIVTETKEILTEFKNAGYEGIELGARFFPEEKLASLSADLVQTNMLLAGIHHTVLFLELLDDFEKVKNDTMTLAKNMAANGMHRIIMTGLPLFVDSIEKFNLIHSETVELRRIGEKSEMQKAAENLERIAQMCKEKYAVEILYHNHFWEFSNDGLIFNALIDHAPTVNIALDVGWASIEGFDASEIIKSHPGRIGHLHLRNCQTQNRDLSVLTSAEKSQSFLDLGEGDVDIEKILHAFKHNAYNGEKWAIIEYEVGEVSFERYQRAKKTLNKLNY